VGLFGVSVEFGAPERDLRRMANDFAPALRRLVERLNEEKKGIFLILDDINGLAASAEFAGWLKSQVDEIATAREPLPLFLLPVGLDERRPAMIAFQPSLARVFGLVKIRAWDDAETRAFFSNAFSKVGMTVDVEALAALARYAGGLPVLAHEIGNAVFSLDQDGRIDQRDALNGVVAAADIVGRKHLEPQVFREVRSPRHRAILRRIAREPFGERFKRGDIRPRLSSEEAKVLDNFLTRMKRLGVVRTDSEGGPGAYRFGNLLHLLCFRIEAESGRAGRAPSWNRGVGWESPIVRRSEGGRVKPCSTGSPPTPISNGKTAWHLSACGAIHIL
jgi:hypothetical protein